MRTTFCDNKQEEIFNDNGYCIIDLLSSKELDIVIDQIKDMGFASDHDEKLRISITQESIETRYEIYNRLSPLFSRATDQILQKHKLIRIGIFDKLPGGRETIIHNHPNIVDESMYRSLTTWVPLTDTTVKMGTLHVINGSHKLFRHLRSYNDYYESFENISPKNMEKYGTPIPLKAGQAIIFNDQLIHWSPPNISNRIRTAIKVDFIPEEAEISMYYRLNPDEIQKFTLDDKYFQETTLEKSEYLQYKENIKQPEIIYDDKKFRLLMQQIRPDHPVHRNILKRVLNI